MDAMDTYVSHFENLTPPLSPNDIEVSIYKDLIGDSSDVLLLGYTKELLFLATTAVDLSYTGTNPKVKIGNWFDIVERHDVIIGDGVLNLAGDKLLGHLLGLCKCMLIIRFFTKKLKGMRYATYFRGNMSPLIPPPDLVFKTQESCEILVWRNLKKF